MCCDMSILALRSQQFIFLPSLRHSWFVASRERTHATGFSILELLIAISIMATLAVLAAPATSSIVKGSKITQSGQMICAQLGMARQAAMAKNRPVEVRFYQFCDTDVPGEMPGNANEGKFRAIQCFEVNLNPATANTPANTTYSPLTKMERLPAGMIINKGPVLSTLIGHSPTSTTGTALNFPIPRANHAYNVCSFQFRPDGSTDLPVRSGMGADLWFLTAHDLNIPDGAAHPPANFTTIQIDPYNGHIKTFRP